MTARPSLPHRAWRRFTTWRVRATADARLRRAVAATPPIHTAPDSPVVVQTMVQHALLPMAIGAIKSFLHYAPAPLAVLVHDGGGLSPADVALVHHHLPGARVIMAGDAAATMDAELARRRLPRCAAWRYQTAASR